MTKPKLFRCSDGGFVVLGRVLLQDGGCYAIMSPLLPPAQPLPTLPSLPTLLPPPTLPATLVSSAGGLQAHITYPAGISVLAPCRFRLPPSPHSQRDLPIIPFALMVTSPTSGWGSFLQLTTAHRWVMRLRMRRHRSLCVIQKKMNGAQRT